MPLRAVPRLPTPGLSHEQGAGVPPLREATVFGLLAEAAQRDPGGEAAVFIAANLRFTWAALQAEAERIAAGLWRLRSMS